MQASREKQPRQTMTATRDEELEGEHRYLLGFRDRIICILVAQTA